MRSSLFAALSLVVLVGAAVLPSCDASLSESCTSGPCGGSPAGMGGGPDAANCPAIPQKGDFPCDVFAVIHHSCNPCHQTPVQHGAPFPLLTYADTQQEYAPNFLIFQQMFVSTGPDGSPRMPFMSMLSPADYATLHGWLGQCAPPVPAGTGCGCPGMGCD